MDQRCTHLVGSHADAGTLCDWLISSGICSPSNLDTGVYTIDFSSVPLQVRILTNTQNNGRIEAHEVYRAVIKLLEEEEKNAFDRSSFNASSFPYSDYVYRNTSFKVPWLFSDCSSPENRNISLMEAVASNISLFKSELAQNGLLQGTKEFNEALAKRLANYILDHNELNIKRALLSSQEWTTVEVLSQSHEADCSEFSRIYYEICRLAGLDAKIVQVINLSNNKRSYHFVVALYLNPTNHTEITFVDLTTSQPFLTSPPQLWVEVPPTSVLAYYWMNKGYMFPRNLSQDGPPWYEIAKASYLTALNYDPNLPLIHYNLGGLYFLLYNQTHELHYLKSATKYFEKAHELDPSDTTFLGALNLLQFSQ